MKFLRRKFVVRTASIFFTIVFLNSIFFPTVSQALTSGPHQPEYTSYEDANATDMVNLLTGDFTFNMPILSVPIGDEGAFTVPLSYHAGIGPEQEASWVGLGWNINVGAITRSINGYPDDADGQAQTVNVQDPGRRGWNSSFLGNNLGWDSQVGHYGSINMGFWNINYENKKATGVGISGFTINSKGASFSGDAFAAYAMHVISVVLAVLTYGGSEVIGVGAYVAMQIGTDLALDAIMPNATPGVGTQGYWRYKKDTDKRLFHTNYWIWLNQTRTELMYGILNLHSTLLVDDGGTANALTFKTSVNGSNKTLKRFAETWNAGIGASSDINIDLSMADNYYDNHSPTMLAYDNFQVNGPGISGSIKPYRLEAGSVSVPRKMIDTHKRYNIIPFLDYGNIPNSSPTNKVPFVYEAELGNRYFHHMGSATAVSQPNFYYGLSSSFTSPNFQVNFNDIIFSDNDRVRQDVVEKKIPQGRYVDWLTNDQIGSSNGKFENTAYMDYFKYSDGSRDAFRNEYDIDRRYISNNVTSGLIQFNFNESLNFKVGDLVNIEVVRSTGNSQYYNQKSVTGITANSLGVNQSIALNPGDYVIVTHFADWKGANVIGGFVITGTDGLNYHYSLPPVDYDFKTQYEDKNNSAIKSTIVRSSPVANTWLLTAITGPDFVDRGGILNNGDGYIDENDWGYWIKFNYGKHLNDFKWRIPYDGYKRDSEDKYNNYAEGFKEKYYLNSIETRSHVALFIKDSRKDAKDATSSGPKKESLRLAEISLLTRDAYKELVDPAKAYQLKDCSGTIGFTYHTGALDNNTEQGDNIIGNRLTYIQANAVKRIVFNTDYSLCSGVPNSDPGYGKLTLKSISVLGRNNQKVFPDYKFSYANNPAYSADKWDGWGMYKSNGTSTGTNHQASNIGSDGWAWSLTSIKAPLGNVVDVEYERDDYSTISNSVNIPAPGGTIPTDQGSADGILSNSGTGFYQGQRIKVSKVESWVCNLCTGGRFCEEEETEYNSYEHTTYGTVQGNDIVLDGPFNPSSVKYCSQGTLSEWNWEPLKIYTIGNNRKGGNLRVKAITMKDEIGGIENKMRYIYTQSGEPWTTSSGVVSQEPDYIKTTDYTFSKFLGYPMTPVLYGKVTMLIGKLTNDSDYHSKQVYEFETPSVSQYSINTDAIIKNKSLINNVFDFPIYRKNYETQLKYQITRRSKKIGKLKSIKTYNKVDAVAKSTQSFYYTENLLNNGVNNYQGVFTEGTLLSERVEKDAITAYFKNQRTTVVDYPYTLQKIVTTSDGYTSETENKSWDLLTGAVLETHSKSPLGVRMKSITEPAYTKYPELGSKAINPAYKNMLTQSGADYSYRINALGEELGLAGGSATTWSKAWNNYRSMEYGGNYIDSPDLDLNGNSTIENFEEANRVWRISGTYIWKGDYSRLKPDGTQTFAAADKFNFTIPESNPNWQKVGSHERYTHFSNLLETKDINGFSSSSKVGYNNSLTIASASNAKYMEMAFSGAEDRLLPTSPYFGGEVAVGPVGATVISTPVHTGKKSLSVTSGNKGFIFKSNGILKNKTYRASVWATHATNSRIYYKINGGADVIPTPTVSASVAIKNADQTTTNWYKLDINIPVGDLTNPSIEVGVKSNSGTIIFDDFRFHPLDAGMNSFVYNPTTRLLEYVLDGNNVFTRYEYNDRGLLVKTYRETLKYQGEKLISENKSDFRRFHVDQ